MEYEDFDKEESNEVEVAIFNIGEQRFGAKVAKIKEFVPYDEQYVTRLVEVPEAVLGAFKLRETSFPLIDLRMVLGREGERKSKRQTIIVTEFNGMINGFLCDEIHQIVTFSWDDMRNTEGSLTASSKIFASVYFKDTEVLIIDFEQVIFQIFPHKMANMLEFEEKEVPTKTKKEERAEKLIFLAEDSSMMSKLMIKNLEESGYTNIKSFINGKLAFDYIESQLNEGHTADLLISDIEMPQMDGLTLCRKVKQELNLPHVPVVMFSSLINQQMSEFCDEAGANAKITKPEMGRLVDMLDELLHI